MLLSLPRTWPRVLKETSKGVAVAEVTFVGRHRGDFLGIAPTGRRVRVPVAVLVGFRDGLMAGERLYWNLAAVLQQLSG